jgi:hypothetical protein
VLLDLLQQQPQVVGTAVDITNRIREVRHLGGRDIIQRSAASTEVTIPALTRCHLGVGEIPLTAVRHPTGEPSCVPGSFVTTRQSPAVISPVGQQGLSRLVNHDLPSLPALAGRIDREPGSFDYGPRFRGWLPGSC